MQVFGTILISVGTIIIFLNDLESSEIQMELTTKVIADEEDEEQNELNNYLFSNQIAGDLLIFFSQLAIAFKRKFQEQFSEDQVIKFFLIFNKLIFLVCMNIYFLLRNDCNYI